MNRTVGAGNPVRRLAGGLVERGDVGARLASDLAEVAADV
jgi:hypothetical protein